MFKPNQVTSSRTTHAATIAGDRLAFVRLSIFAFVSGMAILLIHLMASPVQGQVKYDPEDPEVQDMIARGLAYIEANQSNLIGPRVMFGMAAYKAHKSCPVAHRLARWRS